MRVLADTLHAAMLEFILVIPAAKQGLVRPYHRLLNKVCSDGFLLRGLHRSFFRQAEFDKLAPHVDAFSLMTYDYSSPGRYRLLCKLLMGHN